MSAVKTTHLLQGFFQSSEIFPERPALEIGEDVFTYKDLKDLAGRLAATVQLYERSPVPLAAVFASRSLSAYAGILGTLLSGKGYVPLNPLFPVERTRRMLSLSGVKTIIVGNESLQQLAELLQALEEPLTFLFPETDTLSAFKADFPHHTFIGKTDIDKTIPALDPPISQNSNAYLLFTSGSTGIPKGVAISHSNVTAYVRYTAVYYAVNETDRFSQMFDLTFDLSVHDMFVCWERGACLCVVPQASVMAPAKFIRDKKLTMWFSVPSVIMFMSKMRLLRPDAFPTLRYSLFCGEPLLATSAAAWQEAAPQSVVENLYGPTEATIAITHYKWNPSLSEQECRNGIVPIGWVFDTQQIAVIDANRQCVSVGETGELCLGGSQVSSGYLNNPEKTAEQFITLPSESQRWYRTGDLVQQDERGCLYYLGRIDNQIQIRGYRVELQEIDYVLQQASGAEAAVAIAWPIQEGRADSIYGFIYGTPPEGTQVNDVLDACKRQLPEYMVPRRLFYTLDIPLNANGKIDRKVLTQRMEQLLNEA